MNAAADITQHNATAKECDLANLVVHAIAESGIEFTEDELQNGLGLALGTIIVTCFRKQN